MIGLIRRKVVPVFITGVLSLGIGVLAGLAPDAAQAQDDFSDANYSFEIPMPAATTGDPERTRLLIGRTAAGVQAMADCDWVIVGVFSFQGGPNCLTGIESKPDWFTSGRVTTSGVQECAFSKPCRLLLPDGVEEMDFQVYESAQGSESCMRNLGGVDELAACLLEHDCLLDGQGGFACPPLLTFISSGHASKEFSADLTSAQPTKPEIAPEDTDPKESTDTGVARETSSFNSRSVFSELPSLGSVVWNSRNAPFAAGGAIVLALLILFPSQLINSTLEANSSRVSKGIFAITPKFMRKMPRKISVGTSEVGPNAETHAFISSLLAALPLVATASIIVSFADPSAGINGLTLRLVFTALFTFLILNFGSVVLVRFMFRKKPRASLPAIRIEYSFALILLATVLVSRTAQLEPVVVFGILFAFESGRVIIGQNTVRNSDNLTSRIQFVSVVVMMVIGVIAWAGYSALVPNAGGTEQFTGPFAEFFAMLAIEALATLPLLLLPLKFMPGIKVFEWNRWAWFAAYVVSATLFFMMLMPLEQSWQSTSKTLLSWVGAYLAYCLVAGLIWLGFWYANKRDKVIAQR